MNFEEAETASLPSFDRMPKCNDGVEKPWTETRLGRVPSRVLNMISMIRLDTSSRFFFLRGRISEKSQKKK